MYVEKRSNRRDALDIIIWNWNRIGSMEFAAAKIFTPPASSE